TGKERFIGFLKGMGFLLVFVGFLSLIGYLIYLQTGNAEMIFSFIPIVFYLLIFFLAPLLIVGKERYRLSRSSWSNVRFRFDGKVKDAYWLFIKGGFLTAVTCYIYLPWFVIQLKKFFIENSKFGNQQFRFNGDPGKLFLYFLLSYAVYSAAMLGVFVVIMIASFVFKNEYVIAPLFVIAVIGLMFAGAWIQALLERFYWAATSFQEISFESHLTGWKIFKVIMLTFALIIFTLGIGFPWAVVLNVKLLTDNLSLNGDPDVAAILASQDKDASALYDGISEAGEVIDSISDVFGM
ncbi:MAG: YjgN family protein, partial [Spirochaetia bacterium]|nr:YjgN family protein [Spirochaetia bacterium]